MAETLQAIGIALHPNHPLDREFERAIGLDPAPGTKRPLHRSVQLAAIIAALVLAAVLGCIAYYHGHRLKGIGTLLIGLLAILPLKVEEVLWIKQRI